MTVLFPASTGDRGGIDPIDAQLEGSAAAASRLGPFPALVLLAGIALGPEGLAVLTPARLAFLDPITPVAVAVIGVAAGLNLRVGATNFRLFIAAQTHALITAAVVGLGVWVLGAATIGAEDFPPWWAVASVLSLCAATSSSLPSADEDSSRSLSRRIDFDDYVLPIVAGGVLLTAMRSAPPLASWSLFAQTTAIAVSIAGGGWLLLSNTVAPEQRIFFWGTLLLLGGAADYAASSALCAGLVAGICWRMTSAPVREYIRRDTLYVQHSVIVLVLLFSGANAEFTSVSCILSVIYLLLRICGKLIGGWLAAALVPGLPNVARLRLVGPGVFGVAFALNVLRAAGAPFVPVLTAVVVGTIACSLVGALAAEHATS
jgi:hypothetical protein